MPKVSVIMPVYNGEDYLSEAIESVLNQTFKDFELIIINDCSTDKTHEILKRFEELDKRVKVHTNEVNLRLPSSLNKAITLAQGKYIALLDDDDYFFENKIKKQVEAFENLNEEYGIVSGVAKGIDGLAHYYAIKENRRTIGVIGCGLDIVYPKENESLYEEIGKHHLLLSEYPCGCKPLAFHFPWRNRIIASLCEKVVVIEAKVKSGTMITVNEALELGISVYAFPHNINNINGEGCNMLIEQGCSMINCIRDMNDI